MNAYRMLPALALSMTMLASCKDPPPPTFRAESAGGLPATGAEHGKPLEYPINSTAQTRKIVVAVRADGGQNLPIMYLKQRVATTDASGAATVLLDVRPGEDFELGIDTSAKGYERLRPQNPTRTFHVHDKDEVIPWNAKFVLEKVGELHASAARGPQAM